MNNFDDVQTDLKLSKHLVKSNWLVYCCSMGDKGVVYVCSCPLFFGKNKINLTLGVALKERA
jgi:hypothetical protein